MNTFLVTVFSFFFLQNYIVLLQWNSLMSQRQKHSLHKLRLNDKQTSQYAPRLFSNDVKRLSRVV